MTSVLTDESVLDAAAWHSLTTNHAWLSESHGEVRRYRSDVSPFTALPPEPTAEAWRDLAELAGPGTDVVLAGNTAPPPADWSVVAQIAGVQFVATDAVLGLRDQEAVRLGPADAAEMLTLAERTQPGPFRKNTYLFGNYWGIRRDGELIAMAGQRLNPPGWAEISAVCTDDRFRGQGLASRLIATVVNGIRQTGATPFLHTSATNTNAIRLYEALGFRLRKQTVFGALRTPGEPVDQA